MGGPLIIELLTGVLEGLNSSKARARNWGLVGLFMILILGALALSAWMVN